MNQESQARETYIQDVNLAEEMAYAEKPHIEAALEAAKVGQYDKVAAHFKEADNAGVEAGQTYVDNEQARVDSLRSQVGAKSPEKEDNLEAKTEKTIAKLVERYAEYGTKAEDFSLVSYETEAGYKVNAVIHTAKKGIDLGDSTKDYDPKRSYNAVMADASHIIEVDGQKIDTRQGTTDAIYTAWINQEIAKGTKPLPDSKQPDGSWTLTLLTGEKVDSDNARYGSVSGGQPDSDWINRDHDYRGVRFRPAVVIA